MNLTSAQIASFTAIITKQAEYEDMLAAGARPAQVHTRKQAVKAMKEALSFEDACAFSRFKFALRQGATVKPGMAV